MFVQKIFDCLQDVSILGTRGRISLIDAEKAECITEKKVQELKAFEEFSQISEAITKCYKNLEAFVDSDIYKDPRVKVTFWILSILKGLKIYLTELKSINLENSELATCLKGGASVAPIDILSIKQLQIIESCCSIVLYTIFLGCLDIEAATYVKVTLAKKKFVLGKTFLVVRQNQHSCLAAITEQFVCLVSHETIGLKIRSNLLGELLCGLLQLCFAPREVKEYPQDTSKFRAYLEDLFSASDPSSFLKFLLLIKGVSSVQSGGWLRRCCGSLIIHRFLKQENGVSNIVRTGLEICDIDDWKKCEAIAAVISGARVNDIDDFYKMIGPQVICLVSCPDTKPALMRVLSLLINQLAMRSFSLTTTHVSYPILEPLVLTTDSHNSPEDVLKTLDLGKCISLAHRIFVESCDPSPSLCRLLEKVLSPLLHVAKLPPTCCFRTPSRKILRRYLSQLEVEEATDTLLALSHLCELKSISPFRADLRFLPDAEGLLSIRQIEYLPGKCLEDDEELAKCMVEVLKLIKNPAVVLKFYERLAGFIDFTALNKKETPNNLLFTDEDEKLRDFEAIRKIAMAVGLLAHLSEEEAVTGDLFEDLSTAVPLLVSLLETASHECHDETLKKTQITLVMNVLMMISCYISDRILNKTMTHADWQGLRGLLPSLEFLKNTIKDEAVKLFSEQLSNMVLTHGVVRTPVNNSVRKFRVDSVRKKQLDSRYRKVRNRKVAAAIPEAPEPNESSEDSSDMLEPVSFLKLDRSAVKPFPKEINKKLETISEIETDSFDQPLDAMKSPYEEALENLFSPLLPTRGHALLTLSQLLDDRNLEAIKNRERILAIYEHNLKEEDSYLYLMAVRGLVSLCDAFPERVLEVLVGEFVCVNRSTEDRVKLTEVLTRSSKKLGQLLPKFRDKLLNALLSGVRDPDPVVQAASLSSLGEVCKELRFSIGPAVQEIFTAVYALVSTSNPVDVRRAAVLLVTLLLRGLGKDSFDVLRDILRDLYRALRVLNAQDSDDVVRLHAQLSIEEIDSITKDFLMPKLSLQKKIFITEAPDPPFY